MSGTSKTGSKLCPILLMIFCSFRIGNELVQRSLQSVFYPAANVHWNSKFLCLPSGSTSLWSHRHAFVFPETALLAAGSAIKQAFHRSAWVMLYRQLPLSDSDQIRFRVEMHTDELE